MKNRYFKKSKTEGFTLIELLVVIAIIALLSSIVMASLASAKNKVYDVQIKSDMNQVRSALELYAADHEYIYPTISMLTAHSNSVAHIAELNSSDKNSNILDKAWGAVASVFSTKAYAAVNSNLNCQYFEALSTVLVPKYIGHLPVHPLNDGGSVCYKYFASLDGTTATAYASLVTEKFSGGINKQVGVVVGKNDLASLKQICADNTVAGTPFPLFNDGGLGYCDSSSVADIVLGITNGEGDLSSRDSYIP